MGTDLVVPTSRQAVLALDSPTLYALEQAGEIARDILNDRIVAWTEQGWTQQRIADEIGCSQQAVSKRQDGLGVPPSQPHRERSNNRVVTSGNGGEPEVVDAEVVDDGGTGGTGGTWERSLRRPRPPGGPIHYLPHLLPGATPEQDLHEQIVRWCDQATVIADALDQRITPAIPTSDDCRDLLAGIAVLTTTAARLEEVIHAQQETPSA